MKSPRTLRSRRDLLKLLGAAAMTAPVAGGLSSIVPMLSKAEAAGSTPHRFLQIFLLGGWDSALATDPVVLGSTKQTQGQYESIYTTLPQANITVPGNDKLIVGPGLKHAVSTFAAIPTAFINGMRVEVTAHELATAYMYSGQLSLSRSKEYQAFIASMGAASAFPYHVVLGERIPLGATADVTPPLQALDIDILRSMLAGPKSDGFMLMSDGSASSADQLIAALNSSFDKRLGHEAKQSLSAWRQANASLRDFYAKRYDQQIVIDQALKTRYQIQGDDLSSLEAKMAGGYLALKSGLSRFVTTNFFGFDTHSNHLNMHLPLLDRFSVALATLVSDLRNTADPDNPAMKLSDTTTILVCSEFVRTPRFNIAQGTDHWQSGSAILMGKGVRDNIVVGRTDAGANPMGWLSGTGAVPFNTSNALLPDHLAASLLRLLGYAEAADQVSAVHLSDLLV